MSQMPSVPMYPFVGSFLEKPINPRTGKKLDILNTPFENVRAAYLTYGSVYKLGMPGIGNGEELPFRIAV